MLSTVVLTNIVVELLGLLSIGGPTTFLQLSFASSLPGFIAGACYENYKAPGDERRRWRRTPAVWGEPVTDFSDIISLSHNEPKLLYSLLFVDMKTFDHYGRDHEQVKREVMKLAREANKYLYQMRLNLIVVDIVETYRDDLNLYAFEEFRNQRLPGLPYHNFAVLLSFKHAGGLAFVGGICTSKSVMVTGYYPSNPEAMGSIFFHEVAHLMGIAHRFPNETVEVPNCSCPPRSTFPTSTNVLLQQNSVPKNDSNSTEVVERREVHHKTMIESGCLRIPGFDHDCTIQEFANAIHKVQCLTDRLRTIAQNTVEGFIDSRVSPSVAKTRDAAPSISLCGNGLREEGEQCDCGPFSRHCSSISNCDPFSCMRVVPLWLIVCFERNIIYIWMATVLTIVAISLPIFGYFYFKTHFILYRHRIYRRGNIKWTTPAGLEKEHHFGNNTRRKKTSQIYAGTCLTKLKAPTITLEFHRPLLGALPPRIRMLLQRIGALSSSGSSATMATQISSFESCSTSGGGKPTGCEDRATLLAHPTINNTNNNNSCARSFSLPRNLQQIKTNWRRKNSFGIRPVSSTMNTLRRPTSRPPPPPPTSPPPPKSPPPPPPRPIISYPMPLIQVQPRSISPSPTRRPLRAPPAPPPPPKKSLQFSPQKLNVCGTAAVTAKPKINITSSNIAIVQPQQFTARNLSNTGGENPMLNKQQLYEDRISLKFADFDEDDDET